MSTKTHVVVAIVLALAVALLGFFAGRSSAPVDKDGSYQAQAISGPDLPGNYFSFGGYTWFGAKGNLATGTTTPCSIQSPASTSTLESFGARIEGGQQVAVAVTLSKGAAQQASTTAISGSFALAANAQGTYVASTTPETTFILAPHTWIQVNIVGGSGTASSTGSCSAAFRVI